MSTPASDNRPSLNSTILEKLKEIVEQLWELDRLCHGPRGEPRPYPLYNLTPATADQAEIGQFQGWLSETLALLLDEVDGDVAELSRQAALLYFRPFNWIMPYTFDYNLPELERFKAEARGGIMNIVLAQWLELHPTTAARSLLAERVGTLLRSAGAKWPPDLYRPSLQDCLNLLLTDASNGATELLAQLIVGEMGLPTADRIEEDELRRVVPAIYRRLWNADQFDYSVFRRAMFSLPGAFHDLSGPPDGSRSFYRDLPAGFTVQLQSFALQLTTELAERLPTDNREAANLLKKVDYLEGSHWLLLACAYVEEKGLSRLPALRSTQPAAAATRLCQTVRPQPPIEDDDSQTLEFLSHYQPVTLRAVQPHARAYQSLIEQVLTAKDQPA